MTLINQVILKNRKSERTVISNVQKYVYYTLCDFADRSNKTYTKSILADGILKFYTKPEFGYIGQRESQLDEQIRTLYGENILSYVEETQQPYRNKDDLFEYIPEDDPDEDELKTLNLHLTPEVKENCLRGYADYETIENALLYAYKSPFKSRLDRIKFKEEILECDKLEQNCDHHITKAIIENNTNKIHNADRINLTKDWYLNDSITYEEAKKRVGELTHKDKSKKLKVLKRVCKNENKECGENDYIRYEWAVNICKKLFGVHDKTAKIYVDEITKRISDPVIEELEKTENIKSKSISDLKNTKGNTIREGMKLNEAKRIIENTDVNTEKALDKLIKFDSGKRILEFNGDEKL